MLVELRTKETRMSQTLKNIANWFSGTHEQLMELLKTGKQTPATTNTEAVNLSAYTVAELKSIAKERGLKGYSGLNKTDLIDFINNN